MRFRVPDRVQPGRSAALLGLSALVAAALVWTLSPVEQAAAKSGKRTVLGKSRFNPEPNCGRLSLDRDCSVEGKVTVYQSLQKGTAGRTFVVPYKRGKVVSWSISLSRPLKKNLTVDGKEHPAESPFFNNLFGSPATARIAILRRVQKKKKPPRYKMVRQSPTQVLNPYFGRTVHFALTRPLNVIRNQVVALTIPTWAPAFWTPRACSASRYGGLVDPAGCARAKRNYSYRGSRAPDKCILGFEPNTDNPNEALRKTRPQQKVNSVKRYGCYYEGSRLLYTATVVAK